MWLWVPECLRPLRARFILFQRVYSFWQSESLSWNGLLCFKANHQISFCYYARNNLSVYNHITAIEPIAFIKSGALEYIGVIGTIGSFCKKTTIVFRNNWIYQSQSKLHSFWASTKSYTYSYPIRIGYEVWFEFQFV